MNQIDILNKNLVSSVEDTFSLDLTNGKMGLCIYFYYLSRWEKKEEYQEIAEKLLNEIINRLSGRMDLSVEIGLSGISLGISHLIKEKFVEGDINEILEDVDSRIYQHLFFLKNNELIFQKQELIHYLYYLYVRYTEMSSSDDMFIFQELIIKTIEMFFNNLKADFFSEKLSFSVKNYQAPLFLYVISKICSLNFYNKRIEKIVEDFIITILSTIPLLHANRLFLLWGILHIKPYLPNYQKIINFQICLLKEKIDIEFIMNEELKNQDIYVKDGLSLVYILLCSIQEKYIENAIHLNPRTIYNRIKNSAAWEKLLKNEYYKSIHKGLLNGFPGVNLVLLHIKNHFL